MVAQRGLLRHGLVEPPDHLALLFGVDVAGRVREHDVTAGHARPHQPADDRAGFGVVADEVHDRDQHDRDRLAEVQRGRRRGNDRVRVPQVRVEVGARALRAAPQQRPGVGQHDRVVVDVDDPAVRRDALRDLVGVVGGGDPGADVQELPDSGLPGQEADRAGEERAVGAHRVHQVRVGLQGLLAEFPVGGEIVLPAQPVVVHPGDVRHAGVKVGHVVTKGMRGRTTR